MRKDFQFHLKTPKSILFYTWYKIFDQYVGHTIYFTLIFLIDLFKCLGACGFRPSPKILKLVNISRESVKGVSRPDGICFWGQK
jgi:hypothetical protein